MLRTLLVGFSGLMLISCSGGDGETKGDGSTGSTGSTGTAGSTTAVTTGVTTGPTTGVTTGPTTTTGPMTTTNPATSNESMTNGGPAPEVVCGELPPGVVGVAYSTSLEATGGMGPPYEWEFGNPGPAWLSLTVEGELGGVPTEAGVYMFTVIVYSNGVEDPGVASCELVITEA